MQYQTHIRFLAKFLFGISIFFGASLLAAPISYTEHPDYKKSKELIKLANATNEYGDYDTAAALAAESQKYANNVNQWLAVFPYRNLAYSFQRTARTELSLVKSEDDDPASGIISTNSPFFDQLTKAYDSFMRGSVSLTNADTNLVARPFSNAIKSSIDMFNGAIAISKTVREKQMELARIEQMKNNIIRLLGEAQKLLTNSIAEQYLTTRETNYDNVTNRITSGYGAYSNSNYPVAEDHAMNAVNLLNAIRLEQIAKRTYERANKGFAAYTKKVGTNMNDEGKEAQASLKSAKDLLDEKKFEESIPLSQKVLAFLEKVMGSTPAMTAGNLPQFYKVRSFPENTDCFWNISKYPFVYGDPTKWPTLYQANKSKLRDPENPNLIHPGMLFTIPSIMGEKREGEYQPQDHFK